MVRPSKPNEPRLYGQRHVVVKMGVGLPIYNVSSCVLNKPSGDSLLNLKNNKNRKKERERGERERERERDRDRERKKRKKENGAKHSGKQHQGGCPLVTRLGTEEN